jgi:Ca2+/Na+ antiporter
VSGAAAQPRHARHAGASFLAPESACYGRRMAQAARAARRRVSAPYRRKPLRREAPRSGKNALQNFLAPVAGGIAFLLLYILGFLDVIATRPALATDAFLLLAMVLFFPMRYALRLAPRHRVLAFVFAALWLLALFYPIYRRIYPGERLFTVEASPEAVPIELPAARGLSQVDLLIDSHLEAAEPGQTRVARYAVTVEADGVPPRTIEGEFKETWQSQRQSRNQPVEVLRERRSTTVLVENPDRGPLRVTALRVDGQARPILTLSLYRHLLPPLWMTVLIGAVLLAGAVVFDRATGAGETAASLVIVTAAAFVGAYAFPGIGSPNPTFRELAGAAIVGALVGGPLGGLVAWWSRGRAVAAHGALTARAR